MTKRLSIAGSAILLASLASADALAAEVGAGARGRILAERWCAECHVVTAEQTRGSSDAPSFFGLTGDHARTADGLADFLLLPGTTHSRMPDLHLSRVEIADIVAYVVSLSK